jgi:hypothetical protein
MPGPVIGKTLNANLKLEWEGFITIVSRDHHYSHSIDWRRGENTTADEFIREQLDRLISKLNQQRPPEDPSDL